jgi:hypothetical protein
MTHYLRFPDQSTGMVAIGAAGFIAPATDEFPKTVITASHTHALDVVGIISRGGKWDPETGDVVVPPVILAGWHVNFIGELPDDWEQYLVEPRHPARVFAGLEPTEN